MIPAIMANRIIAIDYGQARIGLAISDPENHYALPLVTIETPVKNLSGYRQLNDEVQAHITAQATKVAAFIGRLSSETPIQTIVIGLPVTLSEEIGLSARRVQYFKSALENSLGKNPEQNQIRIATIDESFTTKHAEAIMEPLAGSRKKKQKRRDQVAAVLILNGYLETLTAGS